MVCSAAAKVTFTIVGEGGSTLAAYIERKGQSGDRLQTELVVLCAAVVIVFMVKDLIAALRQEETWADAYWNSILEGQGGIHSI